MKIHPKEFRVKAGQKVRLARWPTRVRPFYKSKHNYHKLLEKHVAELAERQSVLYADRRYAVLLIFQAMDAAGKDGAIKHVMSGVNPQGCEVTSFKQPSPEELAHDFLWRTVRALPERGRIGIFNRSHYEEVLVVRVHPEMLGNERLPPGPGGSRFWRERYQSINDLERHLHRSGTRVIKFFLHLSREEQRKRFLARIDDPDKNWKLSQADMAERARWRSYVKAYEACLTATTTKNSPWYIVPADDKHNLQVIVSRIVLNTLRDLKLHYPESSPAHRRELRAIRRQLQG